MKNRLHRLSLALFFICSLTGCQIGYIIKSGYNQLTILNKRKRISDVLQDPSLNPEIRHKLELTLAVKTFIESELHLKKTDNYLSYVDLGRPYVSYAVSASEKMQLRPFEWWFPIIGHVPYKGFFTLKEAENEARELSQKNLDTYLRGVSAYSTLGWFSDPLLSSMMRYEDYDLVDTLIHETVHATLYLKSASEFNERVAVFLASKGTELFYLKREGAQSATLKKAQLDSKDSLLFSTFITEEIKNLKIWYDTPRTVPLKEEDRLERFSSIQQRFSKEVRPKMQNGNYQGFEKARINNAYLLQFDLYFGDLKGFEKIWKRFGGDYEKMVSYLKTLEKEQNPEEAFATKVNSVPD